MPKIKTSELSGAALDWAVAKSLNPERLTIHEDKRITCDYRGVMNIGCWEPSCDWEQCGPLIRRFVSGLEKIGLRDTEWECQIYDASGKCFIGTGTPLVAACRAIVSAHLGDEVDIPEELV